MRETTAVTAVNSLKNSWGLTGVKIELEGNLRRTPSYENTRVCQDFILERLVEYGLAQPNDTEQHGYRNFRPAGALVYARFYNDGSVDSELTLTLSTEDPESILLLPRVVEAWNALAAAIGNGCEVNGAGMHMSFLKGENAVYPADNTTSTDMVKFRNFKRSMTMLLPALFFLSSPNERSRGLRYRTPQISADDKYSAIHFYGGALEFRCFDTCYEDPLVILDNFVVMKNCMKYWSSEYVEPEVAKLCKNVRFGVDDNDNLERFYITSDHLDLLNCGLQLIKPSYFTIREIKNQRGFKKTKTHINNQTKELRKTAEGEYKEYEERFEWRLKMFDFATRARILDTAIGNGGYRNKAELEANIEREAKAEVERQAQAKQSLQQFVERKINDSRNQSTGQYTLAV